MPNSSGAKVFTGLARHHWAPQHGTLHVDERICGNLRRISSRSAHVLRPNCRSSRSVRSQRFRVKCSKTAATCADPTRNQVSPLTTVHDSEKPDRTNAHYYVKSQIDFVESSFCQKPSNPALDNITSSRTMRTILQGVILIFPVKHFNILEDGPGHWYGLLAFGKPYKPINSVKRIWREIRGPQ